MEKLNDLLMELESKIASLRLRGFKDNQFIREIDESLKKAGINLKLYRHNSFYKKDDVNNIEYGSVKINNNRYVIFRKYYTDGKTYIPRILVYEFNADILVSGYFVTPIYALHGDSIVEIDDEHKHYYNIIFDFVNSLTIEDLSKTVMDDHCLKELRDIVAKIKYFIDNDQKTVQELADELADNIILAVKKDDDNAVDEVEPNSIPIKEVEEESTAPVDVFEDPVPIFEHERGVKKMTEKVKEKNLKKEFWDEKLVFPIKNKKFFELLNRIYDDLRKKVISGHYALSTNDGGETFNWEKMDNFGEYIGFLFNDNMNVSIYADKSDASKYLKMDVYQTSKDLNVAANLFTVYFNLSNKYFYYEGRGYEAQFNFLSTIMHPALIFFYSDTQIMSNLFRIIFHEYGFDHVMDTAEEIYKKQKIADKARKAIKKEEECRKKAAKKKEKKAAKKEKESKEDKK